MSDETKRTRVVAIARQWIGTPYHRRGRVRGAGADCAMMPLEVFSDAGIIRHVFDEEVPEYSADWMLHKDEELYLDMVRALAEEAGGCEVDGPLTRRPLPGDFLLFRFGRTYSHGVIVVEWPECIHAHVGAGVLYVNAAQDQRLSRKIEAGDVKVFTFTDGGADVR